MLVRNDIINVLAVDGTRENLLAIRASLDDCGVKVTAARSGKEALERFQNGHFEFILLAVRLPGIDGVKTAELLREVLPTPPVPIVFLTAEDCTRQEIERACRLGAVDFITRPLTSNVLRAKVTLFVELIHARRALQEQEKVLASLRDREHDRRLLDDRIASEAEQLRGEIALQP